MKKILGLDLGSSSIGWAFITANDSGEPQEIKNIGVRLVPLSSDEKGEFESGNTITKNRSRTLKRTMRRGYDRYQTRKNNLKAELEQFNMMPDYALLLNLSAHELFGIRAKALTQQISLPHLGRALWHLNQKRGYKSLRGTEDDAEGEKKVTDYEQEINDRYSHIKERGITVGQYFFEQLQKNQFARIKQQVFPRHAYIEEFNAILKVQQKFYSNIITDELIENLRDHIIFYQRPLKSQKGLISKCEFTSTKVTEPATGKVTLIGPKVAPRSSPLFEVCKIWESINNIRLQDRFKKERVITLEEKQQLFLELDNKGRLSEAELFKILGIKKSEYNTDALLRKKGIQGNITKTSIAKVIGNNSVYEGWLQFSLKIVEKVNKETGEVREEISPDFENQPLYKLWHLLYSVKEKEPLIKKLIDLKFDEETANKLVKLDFTKGGFGNKSARAIRKILPDLIKGEHYSDAMAFAGMNHSDSKTKQQAENLGTIDKLAPIAKNSLRQPVVEKILSQLINVVNAIIADPAMGKPDEIRIELARELKQSREERNRTFMNNNRRDRENKEIKKHLNEHGLKGSQKNVERYRLWQEFQYLTAYGPYNPEKQVSFAQAFGGNYDIDHIIPQSRLFDDSFANKVFSSRAQNAAKGNRTAFDYMQSLGDETFNAYIAKVEDLYRNDKISRTKRDRLLMSATDIPKEFINRQLNETRYIVRKAKEILAPLLKHKEHDIICTNGSVTAFLRRNWGWEDVLINLNWDKYPEAVKRYETDVNGRRYKVIEGWSKRDDNRHHAIDALTIACTNRSVIKRMNDLNQLANSDTVNDEGLKSYIQKIKAFPTKDVQEWISKILISIKPGKKIVSKSKNKVNGQITLAPRGPLSEETVYGQIRAKGKNEYVVKYKLGIDFKTRDLNYIVDGGLRKIIEKRLAAYDNDPKKAFKDLDNNPVYFNEEKKIPVKSIRMFTNLNAVQAMNFNNEGEPIGFVKPGNNHHIAIYENEKGKRIEKVVTFWDAVVRRREGLDAIDKQPNDGTKLISSIQQNEMFIFNMTKDEIDEAVLRKNTSLLSKNLFRARKLTSGAYWFNHHLETLPRESVEDKKAGRCVQAALSTMNGVKVRVNHLGQITKIGE